MDERPSRKLPKAARREQLPETGLPILRCQGAEALTLGALAERAGVSKPARIVARRSRGLPH